VRLELISVIN